jgi:hypothetical protein
VTPQPRRKFRTAAGKVVRDRQRAFAALSPEARLLYLTSHIFARKMGTGGFIPREFVDWFAAEVVSVYEEPEVLAARIIKRAQQRNTPSEVN